MSNKQLIAGRYEILNEIGRGGMGLVARAFDHRLETEVAIKVLRQDLAKDSGDKDSLIKEARVLARLTHPSIVRLFDLADTEIGLMLVLEFVRGPNLGQVLEQRGRLTEPEFLHVARHICAGLTAAHAEGVIHRDLKPPNLLVAPGTPPDQLLNATIKITDFGISKLLASKVQTAGASPGTDATLSAAGTPVYMAPEQFRGDPCTPATDVYALGVIAYQALSGTPPFLGDDIRHLAFQHFRAAPSRIESCSPQINEVIQRALSKAPEARFQSANDFLNALEAACAPPLPPPPLLEPDGLDRAASWISAHWWQLVLALVALIATPIVILITRPHDAPQPPFNGKPSAPVLGKIIDLPPDLDAVSNAPTLPPLLAGVQRTPHPGPRTRPHARWTALLDSDDFHAQPYVDGVAPDGIVYVRDQETKGLWAVDDSGFRWGFRAADRSGLARFGVHMPEWPTASHADFRDPGRMWLASCNKECEAVVFNSAGAGGINSQVPAALRTPAAIPWSTSSGFQEDDAQNGHWPGDHPHLQCMSRLGSVILKNNVRGWSVPLDGRCAAAFESNGTVFLSTIRNSVYAINASGNIEWTYASPDEIHSMMALPSDRVLLLAGKDHQTLRAIGGGAVQWQFKAISWVRDLGVIDSTGALYFVSVGGNDTAIYGIDPSGKPMWSFMWGGLTSSSESVRLDEAGRLYLSGARFEVGNKTRKGVVCFSEQPGQ